MPAHVDILSRDGTHTLLPLEREGLMASCPKAEESWVTPRPLPNYGTRRLGWQAKIAWLMFLLGVWKKPGPRLLATDEVAGPVHLPWERDIRITKAACDRALTTKAALVRSGQVKAGRENLAMLKILNVVVASCLVFVLVASSFVILPVITMRAKALLPRRVQRGPDVPISVTAAPVLPNVVYITPRPTPTTGAP